MQAITALAHLRSAVLYFIDISETCGYTFKEQAALFHSIKPLFVGKPLVIVVSKVDLRPFENINEEERAELANMAGEHGVILPMSAVNETGIMEVKSRACDLLLAQRVQLKTKAKKVETIEHRLKITMPKPRDERVRTCFYRTHTT